MRQLALGLWILLLAPLGVGAGAQDGPQQPESELAAALRRVAPGSELRVRTDGSPFDAPFLRFERDTLVLTSDAGLRKVPGTTVNEVSVRFRQTGRGAVIGGGIGGLLGGLIGVLGVGALCSAGCADAAPLYPTGFLLVGAAGAGVGAALGAVIGSVTPGWRKVFPNQPAKPAPGTS